MENEPNKNYGNASSLPKTLVKAGTEINIGDKTVTLANDVQVRGEPDAINWINNKMGGPTQSTTDRE